MLGMNLDTIENYRQKTNDNVECFEYIMLDWIKDYAKNEMYPATWRGLLALLFNLERSTAADNLTRALQGRIIE